MSGNIWLAGVDGCRVGWIAAFVRPTGSDGFVQVFESFAAICEAPEQPAVIAVDIPIGLPERTGPGGRAAENAIRPLLGQRQSSVFSVPSRAALAAMDYREACDVALTTSDPPRKISKQLFMIAPKIREVDACLLTHPALPERVFETHPELAFWRLNGERALGLPKKIKGRVHEPGMIVRRGLLRTAGLPDDLIDLDPPRGAATDDLLDALACAAMARRIHTGRATSFPNPPPRDAFGVRIAIWA